MAEKQNILELESALEGILAIVPVPTREEIPLRNAFGRIAFASVISTMDLPRFDNSAMDGFAVRAEETILASPGNPVRLFKRGILPAGESFSWELGVGECLRLFTGAPIPAGANAVVMQEDTISAESDPGGVLVCEPVKPWENVRFRGEDVKVGQVLLERGQSLGAGQLALLAATGQVSIPVSRYPSVTVLATGSELREPGQPLAPGQIYESNRLTLTNLIQKAGAVSREIPIVPDHLEETKKALANAFEHSDFVVTCGGVSVGEFDFVKRAFEELGGSLEFWKVNIRPGRPFVFGRLGNRFLFGLPGNPVSAVVTFLLLVRPALLRWQGASHCHLPILRGTLSQPIRNDGDRRHFIRVRMDENGRVHSTGTQASHVLSSLAQANGLLDLPPRTILRPGETASVLLF